ncbi:Protein indeterminate-domain 7 [Glycine soja]
MSNLTSTFAEARASSDNRTEIGTDYSQQYFTPPQTQTQPPLKKKRNLSANPDPKAEVVSLSPKTLLASNRFICEICNKGFQRDQNLQLHRRGHNLPWKLNQRSSKEIIRKKVGNMTNDPRNWKAHSNTCGTREYNCDCGTLLSRRDSFITHRAFCDALAEETARSVTGIVANSTTQPTKVAGIVISSSSWEVS